MLKQIEHFVNQRLILLFSCIGAETYVDTPCPSGHYCPAGTKFDKEYPCPAGTFNNVTMGQKLADCLQCTEGYYCEISGLVMPTGKCAAGKLLWQQDLLQTPGFYDNR